MGYLPAHTVTADHEHGHENSISWDSLPVLSNSLLYADDVALFSGTSGVPLYRSEFSDTQAIIDRNIAATPCFDSDDYFNAQMADSSLTIEPASFGVPFAQNTMPTFLSDCSYWSVMSIHTDGPVSHGIHDHLTALSQPPLSSSKFQIEPSRSSRPLDQATPSLLHCPKCDRGFKLQKDIQRHIQSVHLNLRQWLCSVSGCRFAIQGFNRKDKLLQHIKTHNQKSDSLGPNTSIETANRPSSPVFEGCSSFSDVESPPQQQRRTFACSTHTCISTFQNRHDLARHQRTVHMNRNSVSGYTCASTQCNKPDKIWTRLDSFRKHIMTQHKHEDYDYIIQRSARWDKGKECNISMRVVTPQLYSEAHTVQKVTSAQIQIPIS